MQRTQSSQLYEDNFRLFSILLAATFLLVPEASAFNVTVDDYYGDLTNRESVAYSPIQNWRPSVTRECGDCIAHADADRAFLNTWHESIYEPGGPSLTATYSFNGIAVYVFCIVPRSSAFPNGTAHMLFEIDGEQVGTFSRKPDGTGVYDYNVLVYANTSLPSGPHTIQIINGASGIESLILFDYLIYTQLSGLSETSTSLPSNGSPGSSTTTSATTNFPIPPSVNPPSPTSISGPIFSDTKAETPLIVSGVILAVLVTVALVGAGMRLWRKYKKRRLPPSAQYLKDAGTPSVKAVQGEAGWVEGVGASAATSVNVRSAVSNPQPEAGPSRLPTIPEQSSSLDIEEVRR